MDVRIEIVESLYGTFKFGWQRKIKALSEWPRAAGQNLDAKIDFIWLLRRLDPLTEFVIQVFRNANILR